MDKYLVAKVSDITARLLQANIQAALQDADKMLPMHLLTRSEAVAVRRIVRRKIRKEFRL